MACSARHVDATVDVDGDSTHVAPTFVQTDANPVAVVGRNTRVRVPHVVGVDPVS